MTVQKSDNMLRQSQKPWTSLLFIFLAIHPGLCQKETGVSFTSTPLAITEGLTESLRLRCSLKTSTPNATKTSSTEGYFVNSIIVSRDISKTSREDVAMISLRHPALKKSNSESLKVSGHLSIADQSEPAFLQMTWADPKREQSGFYTCEVYVLNNRGRMVVFNSSLFVKSVGPDMQDVMLRMSQMKNDLDASMERIQYLELKNNQLNNSLLKPHFETGQIRCGPSSHYEITKRTASGATNKETIQIANFTSPYLSKPVVTINFQALDMESSVNTRVFIILNDVSLNGLSIICGTWSNSIIYGVAVTWTSFGFE